MAVELSSLCTLEEALFIVDVFKDIVDMIVNCSYLVEPYF